MLIDGHNHLHRSGLDLDAVARFVETARSRGIHEIGFTDHAYMFREFRDLYETGLRPCGTSLSPDHQSWLQGRFGWALEDYLDLLAEARAAGLPIRAGLEVDFFPGCEGIISSILSSRDFDYILGAVHWVDGMGYEIRPKRPSLATIRQVLCRYVDISVQGVRSGLFDIWAHADAIRAAGVPLTPEATRLFDRLGSALAATGTVAEINSRRLYKGQIDSFCPGPDILKSFREMGVRIAFGSDAHHPEESGLLLDEAHGVAVGIGFSEYWAFDHRTPRPVPLNQ